MQKQGQELRQTLLGEFERCSFPSPSVKLPFRTPITFRAKLIRWCNDDNVQWDYGSSGIPQPLAPTRAPSAELTSAKGGGFFSLYPLPQHHRIPHQVMLRQLFSDFFTNFHSITPDIRLPYPVEDVFAQCSFKPLVFLSFTILFSFLFFFYFPLATTCTSMFYFFIHSLVIFVSFLLCFDGKFSSWQGP